MGKKLAKVTDLQEDTPLLVYNESIVLIKHEGKVFAYENRCPHENGPVGEGEVENGCIICPWHGWSFNLKSGQCENVPGEEIKKIPIEINEDFIELV